MATSNSGLIPVTDMTKLYWDIHCPQKDRLAIADRLLGDPQELADTFDRSRTQFEDFNWSKYPFHKRKDPRPFKKGTGPLDRTRNLASVLMRKLDDGTDLDAGKPTVWQIDGDPDLAFLYKDRELQPTRTDKKTDFADLDDPPEGKTPKKLTVDLLLANAKDLTPIVCEVKLTTGKMVDGKRKLSPDKDPFFALIQALASTANLSTNSQMTRLNREYDVNTEPGKFDVYVMISGRPERATYWFDLRDRAFELAGKLLEKNKIKAVIRRIEFLEVKLSEQIGKKRNPSNPRFGYPTLNESEKLSLEFSRYPVT